MAALTHSVPQTESQTVFSAQILLEP
uniref:Uncharacterized protein n=1 Tax=Anguilla anguilla TaxID=7936 RepID=A0A0E9P8Z7_ANGAN